MTIKNDDEISRMADAGQVVAMVHARIESAVAPGCHHRRPRRDRPRDAGARPAPCHRSLATTGFPAHICASVNDEIVHGIPGNRRLREGDIISIDVGAILGGYHGDSAWTYPVGAIPEEAASLLRDTEDALYLAVEAATQREPAGRGWPRGGGVRRGAGPRRRHGLRRTRHRPADARGSACAQHRQPRPRDHAADRG